MAKKKNNPLAKRRAKIDKEIMDAMNPDGPTNPTKRGTRLANKKLNEAYGRIDKRARRAPSAPKSVLSGKNMTQLPKSSLDNRFTTTKKTLANYKKGMTASRLGYGSKPTVASSYAKTIAKQYPKYTGPKAPYTGLGNKGAIVGNQRAAGRFTKIPEGYLKSMTNQKALSARSLKFAKGAAKAGRILGRVGPVGAALATYDTIKAIDKYSKSAMSKHQMAKYKSQGGFSHMTSNPKKRGKQGLDF